ncbi:hypothetical protein IAR55_002767 [Kwoniella newhampshirensis]|uniref:Glycoside hydrolase family 71 protein n=1 Tax=Kwoniella newhampshirensis TaxID=1651941 RepID=A0AAW0YZT6_9TREE
MHALKTQWYNHSEQSEKNVGSSKGDDSRPRLVVAHFMLGNTYPFTEEDWSATFDLAEDTSVDALVLNLGPEDWQSSQAQTAYRLLASTASKHKLKLFLSLDMNVLPSDPLLLVDKIVSIITVGEQSQLRWGAEIVLGTFGGHALEDGWKEVIRGVEERLGEEVFFWPSFFLPPHEILAKDYVDGAFYWNGAWPMGNQTTSLKEDQAFLDSDKPYMAAVSPLFFTHYGTEGRWAWNKNWIYRSDDLLLPTRFLNLLALPRPQSPSIIQIISWNDFGECHSIAPVRGAQPGSEAWNEGMNHEGFRWMARYFAERWRDSRPEVGTDEGVTTVMWYRTQPKDMIGEDSVARPNNADWAQDLINFFILLPPLAHQKDKFTLHVSNGPESRKSIRLDPGRLNLLTVPFVAGKVSFAVKRNEAEVVLSGEGKEITEGGGWNYNMWSGVFTAKR